MSKQIELRYLTSVFYSHYNVAEYPEIEHKEERPYAVLLVNIDNNRFAIPFRTNIKHKNAYKFSKTGRETVSKTGLDFTKAVIVNDATYIGNNANIDNQEYKDLVRNEHKIVQKFTTYVKNYIKYRQGIAREYREADYKYTTLRYFDKELNI